MKNEIQAKILEEKKKFSSEEEYRKHRMEELMKDERLSQLLKNAKKIGDSKGDAA
ncbi:MAG: hypothetical protein ACPGJV_10185 [Bacteriovoracaceae bacterium]